MYACIYGIITAGDTALYTITSYAVDLRHNKELVHLYKQTLSIYRCAFSWCLAITEVYWDSIRNIPHINTQMREIDKHIHANKNHQDPEYDFDTAFPNMPVYFRRAVIVDAIGAYSSYLANHANWENNGRKGREPQSGTVRNVYPTFYRGNMYDANDNEDAAKLKLFNGRTWDWYEVRLKHTDMQYLRNHWLAYGSLSAPTLEKHYGVYRLRFAVRKSSKLSDVPVKKQKICAVDLGINTDATCSVMTSDGTVLARKFINFASDKAEVWHYLNKVKQFQHRHGSHDVGSLWRYVRNLNSQHAYKVANAIADFAMISECDCIVFEHLNMSGRKIKGSKRQKLAMWKKNTVQILCESIAHRHGIRISHICAWQTSKLAYDGSGKTERSINGNYSICRFQNGRIYNCDLSASYNIGARYFIRELQKTMSESSWSRIKAEVPDAEKRTKCTLSTLWQLNAAVA